MTADPFAKPQQLNDWAHGAHATAQRLWREFMLGTEHRLVTEEDTALGIKIQKVVVLGTMPMAVEENATNSLNHLRNMFDQMLFVACRAIGKPVKDGHYPWATNPTDLERRFVNKKTGKETIPNEFWDLIRSQQPYPTSDDYEGGNTIPRAMAALANTKHTIGLEMTGIASVNLGSVTFRGPGTIIFTGMPMPRTPIPYRDGIELMRYSAGAVGPDPGYEYNIDMNIGFDESAPAELRLVPALDSLVDFGMYADRCLNGFRARLAELA